MRTLSRFEEAIQTTRVAWEGLSRLRQNIAAARAQQCLALTLDGVINVPATVHRYLP